MSLFYGTHWTIDGVTTGPIIRNYLSNGHYVVIFEREYASLEQIEGINWAKPSIEHIGIHDNGPGLPEGYGFKVVNIEYHSDTRSYHVTLKTDRQYLGDVTGYQDQITQLESASAKKDETISAQASQLQEQAATIQSQAEQIKTLEASGGGAAITAKLETAYTEGVESNG